jgi:glutaminyl-peptide cyclotransferase
MTVRRGFLLAAISAGALVGCDYRPVDPLPETQNEPQKTTKPKQQFASNQPPGAQDVAFDAEKAIKHVKALCDIGPRISATEGMKKQQELIIKHFETTGAKVVKQEFQGKQVSRPQAVPMTNLIFQWNPERTRRVLVCTHYDTRPHADEETNQANWNKPFVSANDGTSGVALLMELGRHMKDLPTTVGVDFVLFDGEEYVFPRFGEDNPRDVYFIGSEHFAKLYQQSKDTRKYAYEGGVLLDLCCADGAKLKVEANSFQAAPKLVQTIWGHAKALGAKSFVYERGFGRDEKQGVLDDHLALNKVGIPTVDVIDFDYPDWHKVTDTPDKISPTVTADVAKVLLAWMQGIK